MTTSTPTIIILGEMTVCDPICDHSNFSSWENFDFTSDFNPSEDFEEFDAEVLSSLIHSLQSRLIIEENGESYVGRGQTVFHYTFSYSC